MELTSFRSCMPSPCRRICAPGKALTKYDPELLALSSTYAIVCFIVAYRDGPTSIARKPRRYHVENKVNMSHNVSINNVGINNLPEWFSQISRFTENEERVTKLTWVLDIK